MMRMAILSTINMLIVSYPARYIATAMVQYSAHLCMITYRQFSYSINLNELEAVEGIESDREWDVYVAEKTLYINGEATNITLYDLRGAIIAQYERASGAIALDVANGIYLVRCENNNGTRTYKVAVK